MTKGQLYCLKLYLGTGLVLISPMTLIILRPTRKGNKNALREINVLTNAMAKKPLYELVIQYFSIFKVVMGPTFGELMTQ